MDSDPRNAPDSGRRPGGWGPYLRCLAFACVYTAVAWWAGGAMAPRWCWAHPSVPFWAPRAVLLAIGGAWCAWAVLNACRPKERRTARWLVNASALLVMALPLAPRGLEYTVWHDRYGSLGGYVHLIAMEAKIDFRRRALADRLERLGRDTTSADEYARAKAWLVIDFYATLPDHSVDDTENTYQYRTPWHREWARRFLDAALRRGDYRGLYYASLSAPGGYYLVCVDEGALRPEILTPALERLDPQMQFRVAYRFLNQGDVLDGAARKWFARHGYQVEGRGLRKVSGETSGAR